MGLVVLIKCLRMFFSCLLLTSWWDGWFRGWLCCCSMVQGTVNGVMGPLTDSLTVTVYREVNNAWPVQVDWLLCVWWHVKQCYPVMLVFWLFNGTVTEPVNSPLNRRSPIENNMYPCFHCTPNNRYKRHTTALNGSAVENSRYPSKLKYASHLASNIGAYIE